jgi:hypothetical protein
MISGHLSFTESNDAKGSRAESLKAKKGGGGRVNLERSRMTGRARD